MILVTDRRRVLPRGGGLSCQRDGVIGVVWVDFLTTGLCLLFLLDEGGFVEKGILRLSVN